MKSALVLVGFLVLSCSPEASGQQQQCSDRLGAAQKSDTAQPLVVLLESDPWAMVVGADSPRLAFYSDGVVIYRSQTGYKTVTLQSREADGFRQALNVDALACLIGHYDAEGATDQPTESIFIGRGGKLSQISVYGAPAGPKVPVAISSAFSKLEKFDRPDARSWMPDKIEVMIWPYEYAPQESIVWPKEWPGLDSADAVKRGDSYSLYIPARDYSAVVEFLKKRSEKGAIEIGGKKWAADIRFPFPSEHRWMAGPSS